MTDSIRYLITQLLLQLPVKPVKHLKKLLQIYFEVLGLNHSKIEDPQVLERLNRWLVNYAATGKNKAIGGLA